MDDRNHNPNTPTPQKNENRVDDQIRNGGARHELSWRFIKSENSPSFIGFVMGQPTLHPFSLSLPFIPTSHHLYTLSQTNVDTVVPKDRC